MGKDSETLRSEIEREYESDWCEAGLKFDFEQSIRQERTFSLGVKLPRTTHRNHEKYIIDILCALGGTTGWAPSNII